MARINSEELRELATLVDVLTETVGNGFDGAMISVGRLTVANNDDDAYGSIVFDSDEDAGWTFESQPVFE